MTLWDIAMALDDRGDGACASLVGQRSAADDRAALERMLGATDLPDEERRAVEAEIEAAEGTTLFVASTDSPDRALDVVKQDWRLSAFRSNPVILDNHNHLRVVGHALSARVPKVGDDAGKLMIRVRWDMESPDLSVRNVGHQHLAGIRRAGSVGFRYGKKTQRHELAKDHPHYAEPREVSGWWGKELVSGWLFEANELLEHSSATVPMNAEALQRAVKGLVVGATRIVEPSPSGKDAIRAAILELLAEPETRREVFATLAPELKSLMRTDPEIRRIVAAYRDAGPPAPPPSTEPGFFARVLARLEKNP